MVNCVAKYQGDIIKFAGDAMICAFFKEELNIEVLFNSVLCGLDIQTNLKDFYSQEAQLTLTLRKKLKKKKKL